MIRILSIFLLFFVAFNTVNVYSQDEKPIIIFSGKITDETGRKMPGVTVIVKQDGSTLETMTTASSGKFNEMQLDYGHVYTIVIKLDGYATKTVVADTKKGYFQEDIENPAVDFSINTALVKKMPDTDYSVLEDKPVAKFEMDASGQFNPNVGYINQRNSEIDKYLKSLANKANEQEEKFNQLVAEADNLVKNGTYDQAIQKYEEALKIKEDDAVETKIADAENKLAELEEQKKQDEQFNAAIKKGDAFLASNKFDEAIAAYNEAKGIKPSDKLPDQKIAEANKKKLEAADAAKQKQYADKMKEADAAFAQKDYGDAKALYQEANSIKPDEQDPIKKIAEIDDLIRKQMEDEQKYNQFLADGNQAMLKEDYTLAIAKFEEALKIKPNEEVPKTELAKAKDLLAKQADAAAKDKQYNDLITKADGEFGSEKWEAAKATYQQALAIKSNEQHPKDQIAAIDAKLAEQADAAAKDKQYNDLITKADGEFGSEKWQDAKATYQQALAIKSNEQHPKDQIASIDAKLAEQADAAAKDKQYNDLITKADGEFGSEKWEASKATYQQALAIKSNEQHPKDQIAAIEAKLAEQADAAAKDKQYNDLITKADGEFGSEKWEAAKATYQQALAIKSNEQHPKDQIAAIEAKLAEQADAAAKDKQYNDLITKADGEFGSEKWEAAKATYQQALAIKSNEQHPKDQIAAIDAKLAEQADAAAKDKQYNDLITKADGEFGSEKWQDAKATYQQALAIKSNEHHPKDQIAAIDAKLAEQADAAAKDKQYNDLITKADGEFSSEKWQDAKATYQQALAIKSNEHHPKDQIAAIDAKLAEQADAAAKDKQYNDLITKADGEFGSEKWQDAKATYQQALAIKSNEQHPKDQIAAIDAKLAEQAAGDEKEKQYQDLLSQGDAAKNNKEWEKAKDFYKQAHELKPDETLTQNKVDEVNQLMENEKDAELQKQYQKVIDVADKMFVDGDYDKARELYNRAKTINPSDSYPDQKLKELDDKIAAEQANADLDKRYNEALAKADTEFESEKWDAALVSYQNASSIKPNETYPIDQIAKIKAKQNELANQANADALKKEKYDQLIQTADAGFASENWEAAKKSYQEASAIFSNEVYPKEQIKKIDQKLAELASANEAANKEKQIRDQYNAAIAKADAARDAASTSEQYEAAKDLYKTANQILPTESYPQKQVDWINMKLEELAAEDVRKQYQKLIDVADQKFAAKEYDAAKNLYERAVGMRPDDTYPPKKIQEIDAILAKLASENANKAEAEALLKKYKDAIAKADAKKDAKSYDEAKDLYKKAHDIKPDESYPQEMIDWINQQMQKDLADELEKQYQKIIAAADQQTDQEKYDKAISLYERANKMKPDDSYPPNQIAKIKSLIANKANKQKENDQYSQYITEGNNAFNSESYKTALAAFKNALNLKPTSPYPQQKIDEINKILNDLAEKQKQEQEAANQVAREEFLKNPYGEEITGKYTEKDVDLILNRSRINDQDRNAALIEKVKENEASILENEVNIQSSRVLENAENYQDLETEISAENVANDKPRQEHVKELEETTEKLNEDDRSNIKYENELTYKTYEENEELASERSNDQSNSDAYRQENIPVVEDYFEDVSKTINSNNRRQTEATYDQYDNNEELMSKTNEYAVEADKPRQKIITEVDEYKEDLGKENQGYVVESTKRIDATHDFHEDFETETTLKSIENDKPRQHNVEEVESYKEDLGTEVQEYNNYNVERTYSTYESVESLESKRSAEDVANDKPRENNVEAVSEYKDKNITVLEKLDDGSTERTYENHESYNELETKISAENVANDKPRQQNVEDTEAYKEKHDKNFSDEMNKNTERTLATYEETESFETKRNDWMKEADKPRVEKTEELEDYQNKRLNETTEANTKAADLSEERADKMDEIKNQSPTMFSDENIQRLAEEYPQGVTEKMFQRKDANGDVVEITIVRIVVAGNKAAEYKKVITKWGTSYFKNNGIISEYTWDTETN